MEHLHPAATPGAAGHGHRGVPLERAGPLERDCGKRQYKATRKIAQYVAWPGRRTAGVPKRAL